MKKLAYTLVLMLCSFIHAQQLDSSDPTYEIDSLKQTYQSKKNLIKLSFTSFAFNNIQFQYERILKPKTSVALLYGTIPQSGIPLQVSVKSFVNDEATFDKLSELVVSYYSITPEIRFYLGKKGYGKGFYLAPFYRNSKLSLEGVSFDYEDELGTPSSIKAKGSINGNTVGLLIGSQFNLGKSFVLDWWIIGPHYGSASGAINGINSQPFSEYEKEALNTEANEFDFPLVDQTTEITDRAININFSGPWGGARAGLSIGYRF